MVIYLDKF
jgi:hypothetical protein